MGSRVLRTFFSAVIAAAGAAAVACGSFDDADSSAPPTSGDGDASTTDASPTDGAPNGNGDGSGDADPSADAADGAKTESLLDNGDFELGCAGWQGGQASAQSDPTAHGGTKSCRVCALNAGGFLLLGTATIGSVPAGATYAASAWVRSAPDAGVPSTIEASINVADDTSTLEVGAASSGPPLGATWTEVTALHKVTTDGGARLELLVSANPGGATCFLIDDARVYRTK